MDRAPDAQRLPETSEAYPERSCNCPDRVFLCASCNVEPVPGAVGKVGPSLEGLAQRSYLTGTLQNSPENLVLWIQHPQQIHPGTAMPEMGVTAADATRIAAFLQANR
ncbi:MAG TPA: hypothetical protein VFE27_12195 [Acidobacteriaceae bacterium]|nr:hypothetical protein [Acidobacteriaceae bacterium]